METYVPLDIALLHVIVAYTHNVWTHMHAHTRMHTHTHTTNICTCTLQHTHVMPCTQHTCTHTHTQVVASFTQRAPEGELEPSVPLQEPGQDPSFLRFPKDPVDDAGPSSDDRMPAEFTPVETEPQMQSGSEHMFHQTVEFLFDSFRCISIFTLTLYCRGIHLL